MYRQGDLLFVPTDENEIDKNATEDKTGIIARGESTGHMHRIRAGQQAALLVAASILYIRAFRETAIDHQEHDTIVLPPGDWKVIRQREYIPEGWRQVAD